MTSIIRLEDANQTTLLYVHPDHVAVQVCHGDLGAEDITTCAIYDPEELGRYVKSLIDARVAQLNESWKHYVQIVLSSYESDSGSNE